MWRVFYASGDTCIYACRSHCVELKLAVFDIYALFEGANARAKGTVDWKFIYYVEALRRNNLACKIGERNLVNPRRFSNGYINSMKRVLLPWRLTCLFTWVYQISFD